MRNQRYANWLSVKIKEMEYKREGMFAPSATIERLRKLSEKEREARQKIMSLCIRRMKDYKAQEDHPAPSYSGASFRTQKVSGLIMPSYSSSRSAPGVLTSGAYHINVLPYDILELQSISPSSPQAIFARPAPTRPRHGFVESRTITTYVEMLKVYEEALAQDPDAEVILMEKLRGDFSAVASNAGVTWGFGNDGVTSGNSGVFIPSPTKVSIWNENTAGNNPEDLGIKNVCYLEIVQNKDNVGAEITQVVQRRDGPIQETALEYIPKETTVKEILKPHHHNLLEWETKIADAAGREGVVVWNKNMPLSSHYAVHAIEHSIPVLTQTQPHLGDVVKPTDNIINPLTINDTIAIHKKINKWMRMKIKPSQISSISQSVLATSIGVIHSMSRWDNSPHLLDLRAFGVSMLLRYLHSALAGELRHWDTHGPGKCYDSEGNRKKNRESRPKTVLKLDRRIGDQRVAVYAQYLKPYSLRSRLENLNSIYEDFGTSGWDGQYGGMNWQNVANSTIHLAKALLEFKSQASPAKWKAVVMAANVALHTAHNNGLAVTKWISSDHVTRLSMAPALGFINPIAARVVLKQPLDGKVQVTDEYDGMAHEPERGNDYLDDMDYNVARVA